MWNPWRPPPSCVEQISCNPFRSLGCRQYQAFIQKLTAKVTAIGSAGQNFCKHALFLGFLILQNILPHKMAGTPNIPILTIKKNLAASGTGSVHHQRHSRAYSEHRTPHSEQALFLTFASPSTQHIPSMNAPMQYEPQRSSITRRVILTF